MTTESPLYRAGAGQELHAVMADVRLSLARWRVWCMLAWHDVAMRYRRSAIGPFWITIQTGTWALAIGLVYGGLFGQDMKTFLPHVASGLVLWSLLGGLINDGIVAFSHSAPYLQQAQTPKAMFVARVLVRQAIMFLHNSVIIAACVIWAGIPVSAATFMALAGLALVFVAAAGIGFGLATIGARFRDLIQISQSILQVMFFLTPVMWKPEMLPGRARVFLVEWNPFAVLIDVVRRPLLAEQVTTSTWLFAAMISTGTLIFGLLVFARYRRRIAYWL